MVLGVIMPAKRYHARRMQSDDLAASSTRLGRCGRISLEVVGSRQAGGFAECRHTIRNDPRHHARQTKLSSLVGVRQYVWRVQQPLESRPGRRKRT